MKYAILFLSVLILLIGCTQLPGQAKPSGGSSIPTTPSSGGAATGGTGSSGSSSQGDGDAGSGTAGAGATAGTGSGTSGTSGTGTSDSTTAATPQPSIPSSEISYSSGAWKIYGTLYPSVNKVPTRAIVLLPELGKARDSYPASFIESLHAKFPESIIIAIDMRGHGKSVNLGTYTSFDMAQFKDMKTDVLSVKGYVEPNYPNIESYYVIGASMGSTAAILAGAQESKIHKVVMISPGMEYQGVSIERACEDYPHDVLAVSSSGDSYSVQSANEMVSIRGTSHTIVKTYVGTSHGTDMFEDTADAQVPLSAAITEFLQ